MSEGCEPLISRQDAPWRYRVGCVAGSGKLPRERFSPLGYSGHRPGRADQARSMNTRALKKISQPGYLDDVFGEHHGTDQPALRGGVDFVKMTLVDG